MTYYKEIMTSIKETWYHKYDGNTWWLSENGKEWAVNPLRESVFKEMHRFEEITDQNELFLLLL